jgi:hypothetical protein
MITKLTSILLMIVIIQVSGAHKWLCCIDMDVECTHGCDGLWPPVLEMLVF